MLTAVPLVTAPLVGQLVDRPRAPDYLVGSEWLAALVLSAAAGAATGVGAAALTVLGGWYALRAPAGVAGAAGGP